MQYQVTEDEAQISKNPHHIFNLNIILTHLFLSLIILKTTGNEAFNPLMFGLVPLFSTLVFAFIYFRGQAKIKTDTWFIAANWVLVWRRGRILIMSYIAAFALIALYKLFSFIMPGGLSMNDFSDAGTSTPIFQIIVMYFGAAIIFFTVLVTFFQTGISVYDCSKGIIDKSIEKHIPRDENSNIELGEFDDRPAPAPIASRNAPQDLEQK